MPRSETVRFAYFSPSPRRAATASQPLKSRLSQSKSESIVLRDELNHTLLYQLTGCEVDRAQESLEAHRHFGFAGGSQSSAIFDDFKPRLLLGRRRGDRKASDDEYRDNRETDRSREVGASCGHYRTHSQLYREAEVRHALIKINAGPACFKIVINPRRALDLPHASSVRVRLFASFGDPRETCYMRNSDVRATQLIQINCEFIPCANVSTEGPHLRESCSRRKGHVNVHC